MVISTNTRDMSRLGLFLLQHYFICLSLLFLMFVGFFKNTMRCVIVWHCHMYMVQPTKKVSFILHMGRFVKSALKIIFTSNIIY